MIIHIFLILKKYFNMLINRINCISIKITSKYIEIILFLTFEQLNNKYYYFEYY